ncbi:MAG: MATE family efflux transporter [Gemmatimonadetes bacterium]|nr:MATE family efflux transporter [Gemmatimonadota bacterium]
MTGPGAPAEPFTRPSDSHPAAALPLESGEGIPVVVASSRAVPHILHDRIGAVVLRVALPAVASTLLITLFAALDTVWVGTYVGSAGLAAVTTSLFWIWLVISIAEMVSIGLTAVASRRHGEGRPLDAARAVGNALAVSLLLGAIVAAAGHAWIDAIFASMKTPTPVAALGKAYLGTYLWAAPLLFGFFAVDAAFRASGDTRTPLLLLASSVAVTLVLDPVLILGLLGAPEFGIRGAAVATVTTRSIVFVAGVLILRRRGLVRWNGFDWPAIATMCRIGAPTAATGVVFSLIYVLVTRTATEFGTSAIAALGLGHRIESWLYMIGVGFGAAAAAIVGQNLGAGQPERAARAGWVTAAYASAPGLVFWALALAIPGPLAAIFTVDPTVVAEAANYLRIGAWCQLAVCAEVVLEGALGGAGHTLPPMISSTLITASRVPLAIWAAARWGPTGIWWTISLTAIARALAMVWIWRRGAWRGRVV